MKRRSLLTSVAASGMALVLGLGALSPAQAQDAKKTIALIPGLTTDAFYITMRKGAQAAADALGVELVFQGAPDFNPVLQVPVLDAVIARAPDAILIAPTDTTQLVEPLRKAHDAGIPVITVDTFIGTGSYQTGAGDADFPLSYIASDNVLGGRMAARALAEAIGDERQGLRLEREAGHLHHRPARGRLQGRDRRELPEHRGARDPVQRQRRQQGGEPAAGGVRPQRRPQGRVRRQPLLGARRRQRRAAGRQDRRDPRRGLRRADLDRRQHQVRPRRRGDRPAPGRDRLLRRDGGLRPPDRQLDPRLDRHRLHRASTERTSTIRRSPSSSTPTDRPERAPSGPAGGPPHVAAHLPRERPSGRVAKGIAR